MENAGPGFRCTGSKHGGMETQVLVEKRGSIRTRYPSDVPQI